MRIETNDSSIVIYGNIIGTRFSEDDQAIIIKWFIENKPKLVRKCRKELREQKKTRCSL